LHGLCWQFLSPRPFFFSYLPSLLETVRPKGRTPPPWGVVSRTAKSACGRPSGRRAQRAVPRPTAGRAWRSASAASDRDYRSANSADPREAQGEALWVGRPTSEASGRPVLTRVPQGPWMGAKRPVTTERAQRAEFRRERSDRRRFLHLGRLGGRTMGLSIAWPTVAPLGVTVPHTLPGGHSKHGHNTPRRIVSAATIPTAWKRPGPTWGARCTAGALTCQPCQEKLTTSHTRRESLVIVGVVPMPSASIVGSVALCVGHSGNRATCPYWKEQCTSLHTRKLN
jgi:hypothetical protein